MLGFLINVARFVARAIGAPSQKAASFRWFSSALLAMVGESLWAEPKKAKAMDQDGSPQRN